MAQPTKALIKTTRHAPASRPRCLSELYIAFSNRKALFTEFAACENENLRNPASVQYRPVGHDRCVGIFYAGTFLALSDYCNFRAGAKGRGGALPIAAKIRSLLLRCPTLRLG
jgi:hypothetical protein